MISISHFHICHIGPGILNFQAWKVVETVLEESHNSVSTCNVQLET